MRGDEARVVAAFVEYLHLGGWDVEVERKFCDVVARREGQTLYAEVKGRTASAGLDVDTAYGQILRRMPIATDTTARFAIVVPREARVAALRVPGPVRELLRIDVYIVDAEGNVTLDGGGSAVA